jgi:dihydroorotate dehydrogenase
LATGRGVFRLGAFLPLIGMGWVVSGRDVLQLIACGATAVALGAVIFVDL